MGQVHSSPFKRWYSLLMRRCSRCTWVAGSGATSISGLVRRLRVFRIGRTFEFRKSLVSYMENACNRTSCLTSTFLRPYAHCVACLFDLSSTMTGVRCLNSSRSGRIHAAGPLASRMAMQPFRKANITSWLALGLVQHCSFDLWLHLTKL
jgi:hypothetical protein